MSMDSLHEHILSILRDSNLEYLESKLIDLYVKKMYRWLHSQSKI